MSKISSFQEAAHVFLAQGEKNNVPAQTVQDFRNEKLQLKDAVKFIRKQISFGGRVELLSTANIKRDAITNIDKNRLDDGNNLIIAALKAGYGNNLAVGKEAQVDYNTAIPNDLRNAELQIKQDGRVVVSMPASDIFNQGTGSNVSDGYRELSALAFLQEGKEFSIDLVFAAGAVAGTAYHYVEISMRGLETISR